MISCKFAGTCAAPLCPLSQNMKNITWLSSDPVCHRKFMAESSLMVRNQKLLQKHHVSGYFTLEMLTAAKLSPRKGISPDVPDNKDPQKIYRKREREWMRSISSVNEGVKFADLPPQKTLDVYLYPKEKKTQKIKVKA